MATTTAPATQTTDTSITTKVKAEWSWIVSHLLILGLVALLCWGAVYFVDSLIAKHDAQTEAHYSQILAQQTATTKAIEDKLTSDEAAHAQEAAAYQAQITADQQAMKQRDALLAVAIAKIQTYTPPQVVADLQPKLHAGTATVQGDNVVLDLPAARDVDEQLASIPVLTSKVSTLSSDLLAANKVAADEKSDVQTANQALASEQKVNADAAKACQAEITTIKAQDRKSKMKWFLGGFVSGFLVRVFTVK